ncbi:MAG: prepilin-type N-terminal cleavage/methylation domain-containing protein [Planctomycetota bacterium]|nr:prepilin-type N-terminal cleavage/methylation domain-containing protein [Planctomycetota bacterium]
MRRAFTLVEVLVVLLVVAILLAILLPAVAGAREAGRGAICLSNERTLATICLAYADEHKGYSPALGVPYATLPNWALVVQSAAGIGGTTAGELYSERSVLVCPSARARYGPQMQRTYAINVTGHAGSPGDPDNFDGAGAHIRLDRVERASDVALFVDAAPTVIPPPAPPPTRAASVIDFRNAAHVQGRLAFVHASGRVFQASHADGSARSYREVPAFWATPLP